MYNYENSPTLIKCTFTENKSEYGGGLCNNYSNPILKNCIFSGNVSYKRGGAIYNSLFRSMSVTNCTFTGNRALEGGSGMYLNPPPPPAGAPEATSNYITSTITNCIFWDNLPEQIVNRNSPRPRINYCDVQGGRSGVVEPHGAPSCWGEGNIDANPRFVRPGYWEPLLPPPPPPPGTQLSISAASYTSYTPYYIWVEGNYHLLPDSPCIDAGDPGYVAEPNETDLDRKPRVLDGNGDAIAVVDMGAYESPPPTPYEIAVIKVEKAIFEKIKTLEQIDAMLEKDWTAYQALEELLESGDYGDSKKRDITKAMQQIHSSIQHGELSKMEIQRSIEKLLYSLSTLGYGPQPPGSNWPPYVTIIQPEDGAEFSPSQTIEIEADVLDFDGWVVSVEFFANGNKIAEDTNGTDGWTINWSDHPEGSYKLTATATDDKGAATTSSAVEIIVVFLPPPPPPT